MVLHEITYSLLKFAKQMSRDDMADHLHSLLLMQGLVGDRVVLQKALTLWRENAGVGFVDCFLAARAIERDNLVFTKNVRDLRRLGANVPDPLPLE